MFSKPQKGEIGFYDPTTQTAYLIQKITYTNVEEYKQAVAPPVGKKPFATMKNPNYKSSENRIGNQRPIITLYGIKQNSN